MPESKRLAHFETVREVEESDIRQRRERAFGPLPDTAPQHAASGDVPRANHCCPAAQATDLVGLALSGGGIRSGALGLGLLQILYERGVLRQVDYLSTVSGGGYAGAYLDAMLEEFSDREVIEWPAPTVMTAPTSSETVDSARAESTANSVASAGGSTTAAAAQDKSHTEPSGRTGDAFKRRRLRLSPTTSADGQPGDVRRMLHSGIYLRKWPQLLNGLFLGMVLNSLMVLSGLTFAVTVIALLYRSLDYQEPMFCLAALGFRDDVFRALFPSFCLFWLWLIANFVRNRILPASYHPVAVKVTGTLGIGLLASLGFALVLLINTGDVDVSHLRIDYGVEPAPELLAEIREWIWKPLLFGVILALAPYLRKNDLLRSGVRPSRPWQSWIAKAAGWALLAGVPLVLFGLVVREDLFRMSQTGEERNILCRLHIPDWNRFWHRVRAEAAYATNANAYRPPKAVTKKDQTAADGQYEANPSAFLLSKATAERYPAAADPEHDDLTGAKRLDRCLFLENDLNQLDRDTWFVERWGALVALPFLGQDSLLTRLYEERTECARWQTEVVDQINDLVLDSSEFHKSFHQTTPREPKAAPWSDDLAAVHARAKGLAALPDARDWKKLIWDKKEQIDNKSKAVEYNISANHPWENAQLKTEIKDLQEEVAKLIGLGQQIREANRQLLQLHYGPHLVRSRDTTFAIVALDADQEHRLLIALFSAAVFLVLGLTVDINKTSMHQYYRDRLAELWIYRETRQGSEIRLSSLRNTEHGGPYHLINAAVNLLGPNRQRELEPTECFLFSRRYCGSEREGVGFEKTQDFADQTIKLADSMAISGAAVSPVAMANNPLLFYTMILINARLGQWVPHPGRTVGTQPAFIPAIVSYFTGTPESSRYVYVSDGGHHDNTGIESLLSRRCHVIVACDASHDPHSDYLDFLRLVRRMSVFHGIRFEPLFGDGPLSLDTVSPRKSDGLAREHFVVMRIVYPDRTYLDRSDPNYRGDYLIYLKPTFIGDEPAELARYRGDNQDFPHDPTLDQFFDPRRFECYRALGYHIGERLCDYLRTGEQELGTLWLRDFEANVLQCRLAAERASSPERSARRSDPAAGTAPETTVTPEYVETLLDDLKSSLPDKRASALDQLKDLERGLFSALPSLLQAWCQAEKQKQDRHLFVCLNEVLNDLLFEHFDEAQRQLCTVLLSENDPQTLCATMFFMQQTFFRHVQVNPSEWITALQALFHRNRHASVRIDVIRTLKRVAADYPTLKARCQRVLQETREDSRRSVQQALRE